MGIEHLAPTAAQRQFLVTAIERDNQTAVAVLLKRFGQELWLEHRRVEPRVDGAVVHSFSGTPVCIAAYLGRDALAASLLGRGAERQQGLQFFGTELDELQNDGDLSTVSLIQLALCNKLPTLTRALMEQTPEIDWNHKNAVTLR